MAGNDYGIDIFQGDFLTLIDCTVSDNRATLSRIDQGGGGGMFVAGVATVDGCKLSARVDEPKGDPGNMLTQQELDAKAMRLAQFRGGATTGEMRSWIARIRDLDRAGSVTSLFTR